MSESHLPELIEDREVRSSKQDALGHQAIADQILQLVREVETPTNVALYGPWGSGKTGIANLVDAGLKLDTKTYADYRFARYDAFKFAQTPLRRNFINAVATELEINNEKYHSELYTGVTSTKFKLPAVQVRAAIKAFLVSFVAVSLLLAALAALLALGQKGGWHGNFTMNARQFLVAGFPFAALLTAVFALATKAFGSEHRTERADSEEQFEELFEGLVKDTRAKRLIIFVDEIDRCSPGEVVSTLEVIRTFLGVRKCVFIVAADQQVLETALSLEARQATPEDVLNPYYSSGSAYLDKVFQYQIAVPPLPNQSITHYAVDLVKKRGGVWAESHRDTIVSVLVPSHVRSPRRVKHLLNSFVVAHRVAVQRKAAGLLDTWSSNRSVELAKLVCLQVEFPIFARALTEVWRLPDYVHAAASGGEDWTDNFPYIKPREIELAKRFAKGTYEVDIVLAESVVGEDEDSPGQVEKAHGSQLIDYLSRTASIQGPQRDLIYMQGLGAPFGLPSDVADSVIDAAQNGRLTTVLEAVPQEDLGAALDLLVQEARSAVGVERKNVTAVVLGLLGDDNVEIRSSDNIVTNLAPAIAETPELINEQSVQGLWRISTASSLPEAARLAEQVMRSDPVHTHAHVAARLLHDPERATAISGAAVEELVTSYLSGPDARSFTEGLSDLAPQNVVALLSQAPKLPAAMAQVWSDAAAAKKRLDADAQAVEAYATLTAIQQRQQGEVVATAEEHDADRAALGETLSEAWASWSDSLMSDESMASPQAALRALLNVDRLEARDIIAPRLELAGHWATQEDNNLLLSNLDRRTLWATTPWLNAIDASIASEEQVITIASKFSGELWGANVTDEVVTEVGGAVARLLSGTSDDVRAQVEDSASEAIDSVVIGNEAAEARATALQRLSLIVGAGVIRPRVVFELEAKNLAELLKSEEDLLDIDDPYVKYVEQSSRMLFNSWGSPEQFELPAEFSDALQACSWLPEPTAALLRLESLKHSASGHGQPATDHIVTLIGEHPAQAVSLGSTWLATRASDVLVADLSSIVVALRTQNVWQTDAVTQALQHACAPLSSSARADFLEMLMGTAFSLPSKILGAVGFGGLDDEDAIDLLNKRMSAANRNPERKDVLELSNTRTYTSRAARRRYISTLIIPLFSMGIEASNNALDALSAFGKPFPGDARSDVLSALRPVADQNERLMRKAIQTLEPLGFSTQGRGPFGIGGRRLKF